MQFQFESLAAFFWMNGHGPYVWAAYGITFSALIVLLVTFVIARKNFFTTQRSIAKRASSTADVIQEG